MATHQGTHKKKAAQKKLPADVLAVLENLPKTTKGKFLTGTTEGKITIKIRVNHYDDGSKEHIIADDVIPIIKMLGKRPGRPTKTQAEFLEWVGEGIRRCDKEMHLVEKGIYLSQERLAQELECEASYLSSRMKAHGIKHHRGLLWLATPETIDDWRRPIWAAGLKDPENPINNPVNYVRSRNPKKEIEAQKKKRKAT